MKVRNLLCSLVAIVVGVLLVRLLLNYILMEKTLLIPEILPGGEPWTCKVTVVDKQNSRDSLRSPGRIYKPLTLQDVAGNRVQAMTYDNQIKVVDERLNLYKTYLISNATVKPALEMAVLPDPNYAYLWTIAPTTLIQDAEDNDKVDYGFLAQMDTTPFSKIYESICAKKPINVLAIVIYKLPREFLITKVGQKKANEFVIVDEEAKPIIFTLWESFATNQGLELEKKLREGSFPVILAKRLSCDVFTAITVGTRFDSSIEINPTGRRVALLEEWRQANLNRIHSMIADKIYADSILALAKPLQQKKSKIEDLRHMFGNNKILWIKSKITIAGDAAFGFYVGCNFCNKRVNSERGVTFRCLHCGQHNGTTVLRYRLSIRLSDETGEIDSVLFNRDVEALLDLCHIQILGDKVDIELLRQKLVELSFVVGLKRMFRNEDGSNYSVVCFCHDDTTTNFPKPGKQSGVEISIPTNIATGSSCSSKAKKKLDFGITDSGTNSSITVVPLLSDNEDEIDDHETLINFCKRRRSK